MTNPNSPPLPPAEKERQTSQFFSRFAKRWGLKLLCLLFAVILWGMLIGQDTTLMREKVFTDVSISVQNASTMQRNNNLIVTGGLDELPLLRIKVNVPQKNYATATAANYNVQINLADIKKTGWVPVDIKTTSTSNYGQVLEMSETTVTLFVEEYVSRARIPINIHQTGSVPEGYYIHSLEPDPMQVTIKGPKSLVDRVNYCGVSHDLSLLPQQAGTLRVPCSFKLYDGLDQEIDTSNITVLYGDLVLDSIIVEQALYPLYTIPFNEIGLITGHVADGYQIVSVKIEPQTLQVAMDAFYSFDYSTAYLEGTVDVTGATESLTRTINVSGVPNSKYISTNTVHVTVEIAPIPTENTP